MSDTDDTDDLLLIPPDFFQIDTEIIDHPIYGENSIGPYYEIVENLIDQVVNLEDRIYYIENSSITSTPDTSYQTSPINKKMQPTRPNFRKYNSYDDLYYTKSPVKTPQKHRYRNMQSLPASPQVYHYKTEKLRSPRSVTSSRPISLLTDSFQSNVKTLQRRTNMVRNLDNDFSPKKDDIGINKLCETIDEQQKRLEVKENEIFGKERTWCSGDNVQSVPDYGMGIKNLLYNETKSKNLNMEKTIEENSSESTPSTVKNYDQVHSNALNVLNLHKEMLNASSSSEGEENVRKIQRKYELKSLTSDVGLLSLTDIWKKSQNSDDMRNILQKFEEEKLRREHCEQLIKELQNRNLELQEKVAVAIKVDETKNQVILQFQEALTKAATKLNNVNKAKGCFEEEIEKIRKKYESDLNEANQKVEHYEKEASKAINLVHGTQDKLTQYETECDCLKNEIKSLEERLNEVQEKYQSEVQKSSKLLELINKKEEEMNATKFTLNNIKAEAMKYDKTIQDIQKENVLLKAEVQRNHKLLTEQENERITLNNEKQKLLMDIQAFKNQEKIFEEKLSTMAAQLENSKRELKNFYQGQVELLVEGKLKEYQAKLDEAEASFKEELKKRDVSMAKTAAQHIKQISEKYLLEIKLMEEKHEEEKRLYDIQMMQYRQKIDEQHKQLDQIQEKRIHLAKQLQKMMESQWNEAMRILINGKTPTFPLEKADNSDKTIDQLNSLKTKSYNNLEEVFSKDLLSSMKKSTPNKNHVEKDNNAITDTPTTSRQMNKNHENEDLQKYIDLLLNRSQDEEKTNAWKTDVRNRKSKQNQ